MTTDDLYEGIVRSFPMELFPWDDYFARMAETDVLAGRANTRGVKSYFVRRAPFGGSHILLGGITAALRTLQESNFSSEEFKAGMRAHGYCNAFIDYLASLGGFKDLEVYAPPEGTPFFPNEPIVSITGPIVQLRLADAILISELNFSSLSLTKWSRLVRTVRPGGALEFGRRRSQNHLKSSLYGILAGCVATSNSELGRHLDVPVRGTMGHEWVQSFSSIENAFDTWLTHHPDLPIGLVDTNRCMEIDFPLWLDAVYRHRDAIKNTNPAIWGWRNDSGDLAYLTIEQHARVLQHQIAQDPWFVDRQRTFLTNELDEHVASMIISQITTEGRAAGFDAEDILHRVIWAAGTKPSVCEDDPALGGVMKLMEFNGNACIKLALDADGRIGVKTSIPGFNLSGSVHNGSDNQGILLFPANRYAIQNGKLFDRFKGREVEELVACHPDNHSLVRRLKKYRIEPRQALMFKNGSLTDVWQANRPTIASLQRYVMESVDSLPWYVTRTEKSHHLPVSVTPDLLLLREHMIAHGLLQSEYRPYQDTL